MKPVPDFELPPSRRVVLKRAIRLEVMSIVFLISVIALIGTVMGGSQVMKAALVEAILSLLAPIAFLVALPIREWPANERFPYGFHRVISIAFLVASVALVSLGAYVFIDSGMQLVRRHHPTIDTVEVFGRVIWRGWVLIPVLLWSIGPAVLLGQAKLEPARRLHDKALYADAEMNRADWKSGVAAILGVLGIALGFWWADAVAASLIACDILYEGARCLRACVFDLMDRRPYRVDDAAIEALPARAATELKTLDWVRDAHVRLREAGHVFLGEAFVEPIDQREPLARIAEAHDRLLRLDWRLHEVVIQLEAGRPEEERSA